MTQHTDRPKDEHPAIVAQRHLLEIATMYPDLQRALGRGSTTTNERVTGSKERPLPIRESVSETLTTIHTFATWAADVVWWDTRENITHLPDDEIFATIARRLIGVFAPNDDTDGRAFAKECKTHANRVRSAAYPHGVRWVDVPNRADNAALRRDPMPCAETACTGHYRMRISPDGAWFTNIADPASWPPLTCNANAIHIVTGVELARALAWARMNETTCGEELRAWRKSA